MQENRKCCFPSSKNSGPPEKIYIYYLQGIVNSHLLKSLNHFLGLWQEDELSFLFFTRPSISAVEELLSRQVNLRLIDHYEMSYEQWQGGKISAFKSGRLRIIPAWDNKTYAGKEVPIYFDPGVVFGTGNHATTKDCLEALNFILSLEKIHFALDLGTGSGLLAVAAAKLGCSRILAIDLNPLAVEITKKNIDLNDLENRILACRARAEDCAVYQADLIIANIHFQVLKEIVNSTGIRQKKYFILSGLLPSQAEEIRNCLSRQGMRILRIWSGDQTWHTFLGTSLQNIDL